MYSIGCRQLTKISSPVTVIYHILHLNLAANLFDNFRTLTLKLLSRNPVFYLQSEEFDNLTIRQIIEFVATICQI